MGVRGNDLAEVDTLVVELTRTIDEYTASHNDYRLTDSVDPEALATLIKSLNGPFEITFSVAGVWLTITEEGVTGNSVKNGHS